MISIRLASGAFVALALISSCNYPGDRPEGPAVEDLSVVQRSGPAVPNPVLDILRSAGPPGAFFCTGPCTDWAPPAHVAKGTVDPPDRCVHRAPPCYPVPPPPPPQTVTVCTGACTRWAPRPPLSKTGGRPAPRTCLQHAPPCKTSVLPPQTSWPGSDCWADPTTCPGASGEDLFDCVFQQGGCWAWWAACTADTAALTDAFSEASLTSLLGKDAAELLGISLGVLQDLPDPCGYVRDKCLQVHSCN